MSYYKLPKTYIQNFAAKTNGKYVYQLDKKFADSYISRIDVANTDHYAYELEDIVNPIIQNMLNRMPFRYMKEMHGEDAPSNMAEYIEAIYNQHNNKLDLKDFIMNSIWTIHKSAGNPFVITDKVMFYDNTPGARELWMPLSPYKILSMCEDPNTVQQLIEMPARLKKFLRTFPILGFNDADRFIYTNSVTPWMRKKLKGIHSVRKRDKFI